ncbi:hypothetical protein ACN38_g8548 [Penicillium nordicum]|uniref:Uncharacterized protein n=1 Tax=Penicillium nordicum TaxID=229535 RepID=A0A0N0RY98_9EURO|nr:hypothetical protein ACN38_g8548 [Penicillium nordicum]
MANYHIRPSHNSLDFGSLLLAKICSDLYLLFIHHISGPRLLNRFQNCYRKAYQLWSGNISGAATSSIVNAVIPFPPLFQVHNICFCIKFLYHYHISSILQLQHNP